MHLLKIVLLFVFVLGYRGHAQTVAYDELTNSISRILREHRVPGAGVALISRDSIVWQGTLGQADRKSNTPITPNTLFGIGSIAKTFLAMATMIAQEQEMLALSDPIKQIVPSLPVVNQWHETHPVRLIHLLEHTTGFDEAPFHLAVRADTHTPLNEVVEISKSSLVTRWKPGQYYAYNNLGAMIAAHTIEEVTGVSFQDFVRENVLSPLGMTKATYHPGEAELPYLAKGYTGSDYREVPFPSLPQWPAGSLVTSVQGMSNMVRTLINDGEFDGKLILNRSSVRTMETPETSLKARQGVRYGYGKGLMTKLEQGYLFYGHGGRYGGFLSEFGYSRELGMGYVILINNVDGGRAVKMIKQALLDRIIPEKHKGAMSVTSAEATFPAGITGCYQPIAPSMSIAQFLMRLADLQFVVEEDGQLYQKSILGNRQPLLPVGGHRFRRPEEPTATSTFVKGDDGTWLWLAENTYRQIPAWWGYTQFYTAVSCLVTVLLSLTLILVWLPIRFIKKKGYLLLQLIPLLAIVTLAGMVISFLIASSSLDDFTLGSRLFFVFGWAFLFLSLAGLLRSLRAIYLKLAVNRWVKYHALVTSLACSAVALYLLYWNVIGFVMGS